jgi:hypothetical protein
MAALGGGPDGRSAIEEAKRFLLDVLSDGQESQKAIKRQAEEAGFHWRTVRRAKDLLGVEAIREGGIGEKGDGSGVSLRSLRCPLQSLATLAILAQLERPKVPKVSNAEVGHLSNGDCDDDFEERAAILEFDAGLSRAEAEVRAAEEFPELPDFLRRVQ